MDSLKMTGDEIVITGISGRFPNSENLKIFQENILNMVDCTSNDHPRWTLGHPKIPERIGTIKDISKFDAILFGVSPELAGVMDPVSRLVMECAYEAIADSGNNPRLMRGTKCAVLSAYSSTETEQHIFEKITLLKKTRLTLLGSSKTMIPNRISFFLGVNGPSINIDNLCIGSATALEEAYKLIRSGTVNSAIVCGGNTVLRPEVSLQLYDSGLLSPDGATRSFDDAANGSARSEAVVVLFLQKACDAKRIYAEIKGVSSMTGPSYERNSALFPTCEFQTKIMRMALEVSGISGKDVSFVEADGMALKDADAEEVQAIDEVYNEGRKTPLLIGSVKSNVGTCSSANTLIAIVKVLTMMDSGSIPPNLHHEKSSDQISALKDGRIAIVSKPTSWKGDYVAVNSISIAGGCSSVILKSHKIEKKNAERSDDDLPRLLTVSGGNEEAVAAILDDVESRPADIEMLQLLTDIFEEENPSHLYRGYSLLPAHGLVKSQIREIKSYSNIKREVWYLFSGMGSQWAGMGDALMKLPVFADAVRRCDAVLKPHGIDIFRILTQKDPTIFDNIINSFVGIATVQIGLVDLLTYFGMKPDFIIGHSVGELGCAYADGCFTAEQMVLSALFRGMASVESNLPTGSMAAVGLGYENIKPLCPPDIDVACHNSSRSSTISGPAGTMENFIADLKMKGIFAKEVACSNIAFHSRYITPASEKLKAHLQKIIPNPRKRSSRWLSTSVPHNEWDCARARLSSAEYHTNNLLSSVLFAETAELIPANAIVIEIAPHGLLQAIVKKSLPGSVLNVPLTQRGHPNNVEYMMAALGKIYNGGVNVNVSKSYPRVQYPVSRGTPSISPLLKWDHTRDWGTYFFTGLSTFKKGEIKFQIDLYSDSWKFLGGYRIDNEIVLPYSLYLKLAWSVMKNFTDGMDGTIIFQNVVVHAIQHVVADEVFELTVSVQRGSGTFEVTLDGALLCSGVLKKTHSTVQEQIQVPDNSEKCGDEMNSSDFYKELQLRGLQCSGSFRIIHKAYADGSIGVIVAQEEWFTFVEGMLQMYIFGHYLKTTQYPLKIRKIIVNMKQYNEESRNSKLLQVWIDQQVKIVRSGGIELQGISLLPIERDSSKGTVDIEEMKITSATVRSINTYSIPIVQKSRKVSNWRACQLQAHDPHSIEWVEDQSFENLDSNGIVKVEYSTFDEFDSLRETEKMRSDIINRKMDIQQEISGLRNFGSEYAGIDAKGANVMGISASGTLSSSTIPDPELIWQIPESWSLKDAATVPLTYAASYMALYLKNEIKKGASVMVYDGIPALGQASINLALSEECEVFTTYATREEKEFLENRYPALNEDHLFSSQGSFENDILSATKGAGVDLFIYNSSNLNKIESSLVCVKSKARVIVLGNLLNAFSESVGMRIFVKGISLCSVIPKNIVDADVVTKQKLFALVNDGIIRGIVTPLPSKLYPRESLKEAFGESFERSSEKIVVRVQPENSTGEALVTSRFSFSSKKSYLIIDDLSEFGLQLVNFLVTRRVKDIFIASARKNEKSLFNYRNRIWYESGARVTLREDLDLSVKADVNKLLSEVSKFKQTDVIFDLQRMQESPGRTRFSKYIFTKNLLKESKKKCQSLRQFVVCSTEKHANGNLNDVLLKDINVVKLCQESATNGPPAILILWSSIEEFFGNGIPEGKNIPPFTIFQFVEKLQDLIGLNTPLVTATFKKFISLKSQENSTRNEAKEGKHEHANFEEYIYGPGRADTDEFSSFIAEKEV